MGLRGVILGLRGLTWGLRGLIWGLRGLIWGLRGALGGTYRRMDGRLEIHPCPTGHRPFGDAAQKGTASSRNGKVEMVVWSKPA